MTDDIVARLRLTPVLMKADEFGYFKTDYEASKKYLNEEGVKLMCAAADEIERLRKERDEARREVCAWAARHFKAYEEHIARERKWDCFKESTNER